MFNLRYNLFPAVIIGLTVCAPISAKADVERLDTPGESFESTESSRSAKSDSDAETDSEVASEPATAPEPVTAPESVTASEPVPAPEPVTASDPVIASGPATASYPVTASDSDEKKDDRTGVSLSFLLSSIYNYRGLNVYKETSQADQNALFSPTVSGTVFHPGLWLKYAGFFQINGDNRGYLVDSGVGAEQNIAAGFDYEFSRKLNLSTSLTYFFYPFSLSRITGVEWPSYLEPSVGIHYKTDSDIRLGLQLSYFAPIQDRLRDQRYMYTLLDVGRAHQFHPKLAVDFDFSFGYKLFADPSILQDTIFNVEFCISLPYTIVDRLKLVPATHAAWAYFVGTRFGDQYMIYFSLDLAADF